MNRPENDRSYVSKRFMEEEMVVYLGGRVAEHIIFNDITTGASSDLRGVTRIARAMVTKYGFSEKLGTIVFSNESDEVFLGRDYGHAKNYSEAVAAIIDEEVKSLVDTAYKRCEDLLNAHMDDLHLLAKYLLKHEKIDGDDFSKLMSGEIIVDGDDVEENDDDNDGKGGDNAEEKAKTDMPQTPDMPETGIIAPESDSEI